MTPGSLLLCDGYSKAEACSLKVPEGVLCCVLLSPKCGTGGWRHRRARAVRQQQFGGNVLREEEGLWKCECEREGEEEKTWRCSGQGTEIEKLKGPQTLPHFQQPEVGLFQVCILSHLIPPGLLAPPSIKIADLLLGFSQSAATLRSGANGQEWFGPLSLSLFL